MSAKNSQKENNNVHFLSKTSDWETPQEFFNDLDKEFGFDVDVCALPHNAKCPAYLTPEIDALSVDWYDQDCDSASVFWMNPPYGRQIWKWVQKAWEESQKGATVVCLLPARTDTRWFHDYCLRHGTIRFIKGRLKFGGAKNAAPFPSMIVVFKNA